MKLKLRNLVNKIQQYSIKKLLIHTINHIKIKLFRKIRRLFSIFLKSYSNKRYLDYRNILNHKINIFNIEDVSFKSLIKISEVYYFNHKFNILGSGWVEWSYDSKVFGLEDIIYESKSETSINKLINFGNRKKSKFIYSQIDKDYSRIDWQRDMKSGYKFNSKKFYDKQRVAFEGVDIKVPWELSRLHHLVQLGLVFSHNKNEKYIKEFRNEFLDFASMNPKNWGVNWASTMDVSIRAANLILAFSLFEQNDKNNNLDDLFKNIFLNYIYDHGEYITKNLEYNSTLTNNHYLSNITGLLFISSFLKKFHSADIWLAFSLQEFISEINKQFYEDGGNFESSTFYHRLSSEMVIYGLSIILGLSKDKIEKLSNYNNSKWKEYPRLKKISEQEYIIDKTIELPRWLLERVSRIKDFSDALVMHNGEAVQFGDNDSGRFINPSPIGQWISTNYAVDLYFNLNNYRDDLEIYFDENHLSIQNLLDSLKAIFYENNFNSVTQLIKSICNSKKINYISTKRNKLKLKDPIKIEKFFYSLKELNFQLITPEKIQQISFRNFGLYILKNKYFFLAISTSNNGQLGNGGHSHNDKLSFELMIGKERVIIDPGTYVYTPLIDKRNFFRSINIHNTIIVNNEEQNRFGTSRKELFKSNNETECQIHEFSNNAIGFSLKYRNIEIYRRFTILKTKLIIENYCNYPFLENYNNSIFSNGYGKLILSRIKLK